MNDNDQKNVHLLNVDTRHNIPADRILLAAVGQLKEAMVIGWDKDDHLYIASSQTSEGDILSLLERTKLSLLMGS